jgi:hypothetical protein
MEADAIERAFREWQPKGVDEDFLRFVPPERLKEFQRAFRPLRIPMHDRVQSALFAGIKQPFHYLRTAGWMHQLVRTEPALPATASFQQRESSMRSKTAWDETETVLLAYGQSATYACTWGEFLHFFRMNFVNLDTMLVCHAHHREVVLFWEDHGPIYGKRGKRQLPEIRWNESKCQGGESDGLAE